MFSKILANTLKTMLGKLISPLQGGFVKREAYFEQCDPSSGSHASNFQRKEKGMLIKLNMANAFDKVKLSFLYSVLCSFGFFPAFINLIKACIDKP